MSSQMETHLGMLDGVMQDKFRDLLGIRHWNLLSVQILQSLYLARLVCKSPLTVHFIVIPFSAVDCFSALPGVCTITEFLPFEESTFVRISI
jgi:hypothetical protein